ncbi:MAG: class I SAM-dependent methyltransferase [Gammaproteobacteria bacterium]
METIKQLGYGTDDFIHHFPCFTGHLTLARFIPFMKPTVKPWAWPDHIAEIGMFRGAVSFFFAKLLKHFEPYAMTQVPVPTGFRAISPPLPTRTSHPAVTESYERVLKLVECQGLANILKVHKLDVTQELDAFFEKYSHMQFKIVFLDAGQHEIVSAVLPHFWKRLNKGGILVLDQYNFDIAPGETRAVQEFFGDSVQIRTFPNGWMPTAYIVKE